MFSLNVKAWLGNFLLALVMGGLLFATAGTVRYWQGWLFLAVFFGAAIVITAHLARHDPALLQRRLAGGPMAEPEAEQKIIMVFASAGFLGLLLVPALDHRFGWSMVPLSVVIVGNILVAAGFAIVLRVFRENTFTSARIEIAREQRVITTGPYALVRHPMYAGAFLYLLGMPLTLGSYWGLLVLIPMTAAVIWRLFDEEAVGQGPAGLCRLPALGALAVNTGHFLGISPKALAQSGGRLQKAALWPTSLARRPDGLPHTLLSDAGVAQG